MSLGRRNVRLEDEQAWVFNRMVEAYEARPAYPEALLDALARLACEPHARIGDVGAGIGHLALPLAARGHRVTAIEPASKMLERLSERATHTGVQLEALHGMAESIAVEDGAFDLVIVSDAVHFLDAERAAYELKRVLAPAGSLALITCEFSSTPFMEALAEVMHRAAPRRPRDVSSALTQLLAVAGINEAPPQAFQDETPVTQQQLAQILGSISFIGPAMNPERAAAFLETVRAIPYATTWARSLKVRSGTRRRMR